MSIHITLGADEDGYVYGLEMSVSGTWIRNSLGYSTSCYVIRPMKRKIYEYITEDPDSAKELWQQCVAADRTEMGLEDWFEDYKSSDELFDKSFVTDLLDDDENPTVSQWKNNRADEVVEFESFREYVEDALINSEEVKSVENQDDVYEWESAGIFPPKKPFVVEFAPRKILDEYYAHLRKTYKDFKV